MNDFTHIDNDGNLRMVDVTDKLTTSRRAVAESAITLNKTTIQQIQDSKIPKGNVLTAAKIAGIQAAKLTSQIIPLCHPIPITLRISNFRLEKITSELLQLLGPMIRRVLKWKPSPLHLLLP